MTMTNTTTTDDRQSMTVYYYWARLAILLNTLNLSSAVVHDSNNVTAGEMFPVWEIVQPKNFTLHEGYLKHP